MKMRRTGKKYRSIKKAVVLSALTIVCTAGFFVLLNGSVFGRFTAKEPFVTGDAAASTVTVTSEGSNQKGKDGSGAEPCSPEVPTCEGKKGTKNNPFVVLEIVPDKAEQQLIYLGEEEEGTYPLDIMKIGIEAAKNNNKTYAESSAVMQMSELGKVMGQWFSVNSYSVYKYGSDEEKESMTYAEIGQIYKLRLTDESINRLMDDDTAAERFEEIFKETKQEYARDWHDIEKLTDEFPALFKKDDNGKKIRDIAKTDRYNWKVEKNTALEEEKQTYKSGYMLMVEPGEGDFGFASEEDCKNWRFTKTGTDADRFIYVEDEETAEANYPEYLERYKDDKERLYKSGFYYEREDGVKTEWLDLGKLYAMQEDSILTGLMLKLENDTECSYVKNPAEYEYVFRYYGVKNNNILKRALFTFKNEKEYENFHMQVICMTPAELNQLSKADTDATIDMIERADMYFIQSGDLDGNTVNETALLRNMYYTYVAPSEKDNGNEVTFFENDLEWSLCQKIIQRQSSVQTLPLVFNQMVGKMLELGVSRNTAEKETHVYVTEGNGEAQSRLTDVHAKGSRNNLSKLYLITIQFDLLARKTSNESYERTFMEDIYPDIKTISLPSEDGCVNGTAKTTGYYSGSYAAPKKLCTCDASQDFKERVYYLWNTYTFLPVDLSVNLNGNLTDETKEELVSQGYQDSFFNTNDGNAFSGGNSPSHQSGSDGTDEKNVTIISDGSNSNTNHSSILGNKGDTGAIANAAFEAIFQIMNNQTDAVNPVTVTAEEQRKMYVKIADDTVMVDYEDDGKKISGDRTMYLKVRIWNNENNRPGQVKSIYLVNEKTGEKKRMKLYADKTFTKECENWEGAENQYMVSADDAYLEGYVCFQLNDWKSGYTTMQFKTVGRIYNKKKKKEIEGETVKTDIAIIGKTLFDLE